MVLVEWLLDVRKHGRSLVWAAIDVYHTMHCAEPFTAERLCTYVQLLSASICTVITTL